MNTDKKKSLAEKLLDSGFSSKQINFTQKCLKEITKKMTTSPNDEINISEWIINEIIDGEEDNEIQEN